MDPVALIMTALAAGAGLTAQDKAPPPNLRIKSSLLCSFIMFELLSNNARTCRELSFCPVARMRASPRIPGGAGPYRGIEQTWSKHRCVLV